jgi:rhodanese-related sulfurtransferase
MRYLAFFIAATASVLSACAAGEDGLDNIHADIASDHSSVAQISPEAFLKLASSDTILLDIRDPEEYAVSRLPGAIWVTPGASAETALIQMGDVTGKKIIVYCSVGKRSSIFAEREQDALLAMGATSVANLEKGIFGWHNESRPLVDAQGLTDAVHPYDAVWKRYVERDEQASYTPIPKE